MIVSCSKNSSTEPSNSKQDISNIKTESGNFGTEVNQILETEGGKALISFNSIQSNSKSNPILLNLKNSFLKLDRTGLLKQIIPLSNDAKSELDWKEAWGTYIWNPNLHDWDTVLDSTLGMVIFKFPKDLSSSENDAKLEWTNYSETLNSIADSLHCNLYINDINQWNKVAYIDYSATFDENDLPTNISFTLSVIPYSINFTFSQTSTKVSFDFETIKAGNATPLFSFGGYIEFSDITNIKNSITKIGAHFQYGKMKLLISFDFEKFNSIQNPTIDDFNEALDGGFYYANKKVGTITLILDEEANERNIFVVFNDGTNIKLEDLLEEFFNSITYDLKAFFSNFTK